jgi:hypothetical protein
LSAFPGSKAITPAPQPAVPINTPITAHAILAGIIGSSSGGSSALHFGERVTQVGGTG